jgi:hypothetical protein
MVEVGDKVFIRFASYHPYNQWRGIIGRTGTVIYKDSNDIFVRIEEGYCKGGIPRQHVTILRLKEDDVLKEGQT